MLHSSHIPDPQASALNSASGVASNLTPPSKITYPIAPRDDSIVDNFHGVLVRDPFRPLEDSASSATIAWVAGEQNIAAKYLQAIPERDTIAKRLTELFNTTEESPPAHRGSRYFFSRHEALKEFPVYYKQETLDSPEEVLLDPNTLSSDHTVSVATTSISRDGRLLAYGLSKAGSDWIEFHVRNIDTGQDLADKVEHVKFSSAAWDKKGEGFYYSRFPEAPPGLELQAENKGMQVFYHRLGTNQADDKLIFEQPSEPSLGWYASVSKDGRYLIIHGSKGSSGLSHLLYQDLDNGSEIKELTPKFDAHYSFIGNKGTKFYILTDKDAPRSKLVEIDIASPDPANWKTVIPENSDALESVKIMADRFVAHYLKNVSTRVAIYLADGQLERDLPLPGIGTAGGLTGEETDREGFYSFSSFNYPDTTYRYDFDTGRSEVYKASSVPLDPNQFVTKQIWYQSKDGTSVPMFVVHKHDLVLDGNNPTYLSGYGGFNHSLRPGYAAWIRPWLERGGVFVQPSLRGGGEFGEEWHKAGMLENKQNVFDDFISAGEWLIANGYTDPSKLAISGGSNGGLLVGACLTQRPDLFGAAISAVGVLDMLRFHKFTVGHYWITEYGSAEDPKMFPILLSYSPLHNIKPGTKYPATLIMTGDHDDRVAPAHSYKFAAALQEAQAGDKPCLLRVETNIGHGGGSPLSMMIRQIADEWAFLVKELGVLQV